LCFFFGGKLLQIGNSFWEKKLEANENSRKISGGSIFLKFKNTLILNLNEHEKKIF
jgi:hypothetical protein